MESFICARFKKQVFLPYFHVITVILMRKGGLHHYCTHYDIIFGANNSICLYCGNKQISTKLLSKCLKMNQLWCQTARNFVRQTLISWSFLEIGWRPCHVIMWCKYAHKRTSSSQIYSLSTERLQRKDWLVGHYKNIFNGSQKIKVIKKVIKS